MTEPTECPPGPSGLVCAVEGPHTICRADAGQLFANHRATWVRIWHRDGSPWPTGVTTAST